MGRVKGFIEETIWKAVFWIDSEYLFECVDHFYIHFVGRWHYRYVRLPTVKRVVPTTIPKKMLTKTVPLNTPSGYVFTLDFKLTNEEE